MTIILGILKLILTVLIVLLVIACVLVTLILFAPVSYKLKGSFINEVPDARAELRWLHGVLSAKAIYTGELGLEAYVNVFGHKVYDVFGDDDESGNEAEVIKDSPPAKLNDYNAQLEDMQTDALCSSKGMQSTVNEYRPKISVYSANPLSGLHSRMRAKLPTKPVNILRKASDWISNKIDAAESKLKEIFDRLKELAKAAKAAFTKRSTQLKKLKALWEDKRFAAGKALLLSRVVRLLSELKPRKGNGYVRIGMDDPYSTGQAMQAAAFLYPFYAETIELIPDFDQSILEGELDIGGRIRLIIPAEAAIRIFFNKELKLMYRKARHILELD